MEGGKVEFSSGRIFTGAFAPADRLEFSTNEVAQKGGGEAAGCVGGVCSRNFSEREISLGTSEDSRAPSGTENNTLRADVSLGAQGGGGGEGDPDSLYLRMFRSIGNLNWFLRRRWNPELGSPNEDAPYE